MEKGVNARAEAIKEMSREKARIFRRRIEGLSLLEEAALAWKKKKEMEEGLRQKEGFKKELLKKLSFRQTLAKEIVDYDKQRLPTPPAGGPDEIGWVQYKPLQKEEDKKKKQIPLNTATVVALRKKIIAKEWARALGKRTQDTRFRDLEQEAVIWQQKKEEKKRREEEIRMRIERYKELLSEALAEFGKRLRQQKDMATERLERPEEVPSEAKGQNRGAMDPKKLSAILEESLENAGEVFDIEWQENGCFVWIEPWQEKKLRNIMGLNIPVIYRVKIDENFEISSYEKVEDEEIIESLREEVLTKPLRESLEGVSFNIDNEEEAKEFLEDKLSDIGRLINLERTESGWFATIEPWEEMKLRNVKRRGKPPIITEEIEIDWKDGKLEFVPLEEEEGGDEEDLEEEE